jgi:hypothetical protein
MTDYENAASAVKARYDDQIAKHGRITNMKRTLLHNVQAFDTYMQWYDLETLLEEFIPHRAAMLYSYAISSGSRCLVCSVFFRKILIDSGEDPDHPLLSADEEKLMDLGFSIAEDPHNIDPALYAWLAARFNAEQRVLLFTFAGMMVATNLFNTVAKVDLDEVLYKYRKKG